LGNWWARCARISCSTGPETCGGPRSAGIIEAILRLAAKRGDDLDDDKVPHGRPDEWTPATRASWHGECTPNRPMIADFATTFRRVVLSIFAILLAGAACTGCDSACPANACNSTVTATLMVPAATMVGRRATECVGNSCLSGDFYTPGAGDGSVDAAQDIYVRFPRPSGSHYVVSGVVNVAASGTAVLTIQWTGSNWYIGGTTCGQCLASSTRISPQPAAVCDG
jgi:hypothetical protein